MDCVSLPRRLLARGWCSFWRSPWPQPAFAQLPQLPTLPLTQLDERGPAADLDNRTFTLTFAQPVPVRDLLLLLVRGTNLSLIPDPAIAGSFIGELKNVTVRQALDLDSSAARPRLSRRRRVHSRVRAASAETRIFDINYIATERSAASTVGGRSVDPAGLSSASVSTVTTTDRSVRGSHQGRPDAAVRPGDVQRRSQGGAAAGDRLPGAPRSRRRLSRCGAGSRPPPGRRFDARIVEVELKDADARPASTGRAHCRRHESAVRRPRPRHRRRRSLTGLRVTDLSRFMASARRSGKGDDRWQNTRMLDAEQRAGHRPKRDADVERHAADRARRRRDAEPEPDV